MCTCANHCVLAPGTKIDLHSCNAMEPPFVSLVLPQLGGNSLLLHNAYDISHRCIAMLFGGHRGPDDSASRVGPLALVALTANQAPGHQHKSRTDILPPYFLLIPNCVPNSPTQSVFSKAHFLV